MHGVEHLIYQPEAWVEEENPAQRYDKTGKEKCQQEQKLEDASSRHVRTRQQPCDENADDQRQELTDQREADRIPDCGLEAAFGEERLPAGKRPDDVAARRRRLETLENNLSDGVHRDDRDQREQERCRGVAQRGQAPGREPTDLEGDRKSV